MAKQKNGEESLATAETAEQFALALQMRMASGDSTTAEARIAELVAQLRGWTVGKIPKAATPAAELPATVKSLPVEEPHW